MNRLITAYKQVDGCTICNIKSLCFTEYEDSSDDDDDDMLGNLSASEEPDCEEPVSSSTLSPVAIPEVTQTRKKCSTSKPVGEDIACINKLTEKQSLLLTICCTALPSGITKF